MRRVPAACAAVLVACLVLAGWAVWSGGLFDGPAARQVAQSSVYAAPGVELDQEAAERIIGNRRLVVVFLEPEADLRDGCDDLERAADGTVVLLLSREGGEYASYGCALLPGRGEENFGRAFVAELAIRRGVHQFADRPLEALKIVAVNYDQLVRAGTVPDGGRVLSPSPARHLLAAAALLAVLVGSAALYLLGGRAGGVVARGRARAEGERDARSRLSAATGELAQRIVELDDLVTPAVRAEYLALVTDCADLAGSVADADRRGGADPEPLTRRAEALTARADRLARRLGQPEARAWAR
ncbi:hypothetical protein KCV87_10340 [Actinosynnema pretiosum subsp. pretiosum]|uniref:TPM domain-containing protein n=1 Tax=Actinosynnema pretiosum subsp. pretiosum TaxID=103721 RepID=A0AA45LB88_9PSEU|nr:hypothetical protein APASM_1972 [Actinosynnema pretiosum subsp. pretiosum]QUF06413.1 hypothetical protein KCV87_10340 [Actinosynnema pretiosum subsp. pretiosum]